MRVGPTIGIDGSRIGSCQPTGTETYSTHIVRGLLAEGPRSAYRVYLNRCPSSELPVGLIQSDVRPIPLRRLWTHARLSAEMLLSPPDLLFVPAHVIPAIHPASVVTIHDLGYLAFPDAHPPRQRRMLEAATRWNAWAARAIIVPSLFTKDDVVSRLGVPAERIHVIPHGVEIPRRQEAIVDRSSAARSTFERPFVLAVGTLQPRKNYGRLAQALAIVRSHGLDIDLVIAGKPGWNSTSVEQDVHSALRDNRLHVLNYVSSEMLHRLYATCMMFVQPSLFEGFGMPVLEAMAAGAPVVSSSTSSLPEVGGDVAHYVDPMNVEHIAAAIEHLAGDVDERLRLGALGRARASLFSWSVAARQTREVLWSIAGTPPEP